MGQTVKHISKVCKRRHRTRTHSFILPTLTSPTQSPPFTFPPKKRSTLQARTIPRRAKSRTLNPATITPHPQPLPKIRPAIVHVPSVFPRILLPFCQWRAKTCVTSITSMHSSKNKYKHADPPITFADHLWRRRQQLSLSQRSAANRCGVSDAGYRRWEHAEALPEKGHLKSVIEFLGFDPFGR